MVVLGLAAYVGLIYGLTVLPLQFEVPLPHWGMLLVPFVVYGLVVVAFVRHPSLVRWLVGTAVLGGLHILLGLAREPLTAVLDPALAGRPLPWMLPPPLPEFVGVILLLVPLRDVLRARPRLARERAAGSGRGVSPRARGAVLVPRPPAAAPAEASGSLSETLVVTRSEAPPEKYVAPAAAPAPAPALVEEPRRRRARRQEAEVARPLRRSDVVLRIALDRIMGQLPPGTFLAPEDEVAASLRDPGYLLIPAQLVVTQLSEGIARVAWSDIVDQFPPDLVGLGSAEIGEHLGDGLRLPLDEVVGQLPHELFVADTPEIEMPGLERIPVPFHPVAESESAPATAREPQPETRPAPVVERRPAAEVPALVVPPAVETAVERPAVVPLVAPSPPAPVDEPVAATPGPVPMPDPEPIVAPAPVSRPAVQIDGPTVRISFARVASDIPADAFRIPLEQLAERLHEPGALLIPQALVVPQLGEGLIRVGWETVATQFPREEMTVSHGEMMERLSNGIRLPLDEVIRQIPPDLFMNVGPAVDVRGLESFPAPFQPLLSDPAPEPPPAAPAAVSVAPPAVAPEPVAAPVLDVAPGAESEVVASPEPEAVAAPAPIEPVVDEVPAPRPVPLAVNEPSPLVEQLDERPRSVVREAETVPAAPAPSAESPAVPTPPVEVEAEPMPLRGPEPVAEPEPVRVAQSWPDLPTPAPIAMAVAGPAETAEARRIVGMLAPIASFEASVQVIEGVIVFAMAAPAVAQESAVAAAGLSLPLLTDRRAPWPIDQITLRGPETALVLTPLGGPGDRSAVLATAAPRGGALALLEILCRRAAGARRVSAAASDPLPVGGRHLVPAPVPARAATLAPSLSAFGTVTASVLRDAEGEATLYFFLPPGADVPAVAAFAQDLQAVMRKAAGSGAVYRTAVLRSGDTFLVIHPEEVGHGRSVIVVAGGEVTRPGLAYRQIERATSALAQA
jgi:hypothetical protein